MNNFSEIRVEKKIDKSPKQEDFTLHMDDFYEIYYFLSGNARYVIEGMVYPLRKGDLILLRPAESHRLILQSGTAYQRTVIHFTLSDLHNTMAEKMMCPFINRPLGKFNFYPSSIISSYNLIYYIDKIINSNDNDIRSAYLTVLLCELADIFEHNQNLDIEIESTSITNIIYYINTHLSQKISLQQICDSFFISKSQLNRNFKHTLGITVWEYITEKRLLLAKKYIDNGEKATKIYSNCGFSDYSVFYRAYRSKFGISPSQSKPG